MVYEVLARKWRPQIFKDVIGQEHITQTLLNAVQTDRLAHAYLFSGARGVGKTSVARILAKAVNCQNRRDGNPCNQCSSCVEITNGSSIDVLEIDGASNRGIDEIRELRENIKYMSSSGRFRVYIIDEVHMLTLPAFNALLKTLEEPPPHVKFIFATTEPHKVPVTILSRCQRFDFKRISLISIINHLEAITQKEGIQITKSGLAIIAREAEGSMRDAESLLDQVASFSGTTIEDKNIIDILGIIDRDLLFETSKSIIEGSAVDCIRIVEQIYNYGYDIKEFYRALMDQFRNLMVSLVSSPNDLLGTTDSDAKEIKSQAEIAGLEKLQQALNILIAKEEDLRFTSHPRLILETIMIKLCRIGDRLSFDELIKKVEDLEKRLSMSRPSSPDTAPVHQISESESTWEAEKKTEKADEPGLKRDHDGLEWHDFLEYLIKKNQAMANVMKEWHVKEFKDNTLELIKGTSSFSSTYLDDSDRLERLTGYCRDFFSRDIVIRIINGNPNHTKTIQSQKVRGDINQGLHSEIPAPVQEVIRVFKGKIKTEVRLDNK
ncbi:MAG: DNA polymerase III subunit gamma/tau [Deltaproteobacteria bacterium]|nr:DNA polymerase III subunit gamma/tau [Deltaproteobacteria bacterium]